MIVKKSAGSRPNTDPREGRFKHDVSGPLQDMPQRLPGETYLGRQTCAMARVPPLMICWILSLIGRQRVEDVLPEQWEAFMLWNWKAINWIWRYWPRCTKNEWESWEVWSEAKRMAASWIWPETTKAFNYPPWRPSTMYQAVTALNFFAHRSNHFGIDFPDWFMQGSWRWQASSMKLLHLCAHRCGHPRAHFKERTCMICSQKRIVTRRWLDTDAGPGQTKAERGQSADEATKEVLPHQRPQRTVLHGADCCGPQQSTTSLPLRSRCWRSTVPCYTVRLETRWTMTRQEMGRRQRSLKRLGPSPLVLSSCP
jgi:hypothetical protein